MSASRDGPDELRRAMSIYLDEHVAGGEPADSIVRRYPELRELLEPLLLGEELPCEPGDGTGSPVPGGLAAGGVIGDFRLVRELGRGGMGVVWEAVESSLGRTVALKLLPSQSAADPKLQVRLQREASAAAGLDHPNIVRVHRAGWIDGLRYIAMDFVPGAALDGVLRTLRAECGAERGNAVSPSAEQLRRTIAARYTAPAGEGAVAAATAEQRGRFGADVARLMIDLADALAHAHAAGVVHRDVKPANAIVRPDGRAVLTDFGIARRDGALSVTGTGDVPGTPQYVAPERLRGGGRAEDGRADVFALGVTMYECLTLRRPFDGDSPEQVMHRVLHIEPVEPQVLNPELPGDLCAITMKALEKDPAHRYASAAELAADLRAFLDYRPVRARRPGPVERVRRWARREPALAVLLATALAAVPVVTAAVGYWAALQPQLAAGEHALLEERIEDRLAEGLFELDAGRLESARRAFAQALADDGERVEAVAGQALAAEREGGPEAGLAVLAALPDALARRRELRRLSAELLLASGDEEAAAAVRDELGQPVTPLEHFVAGLHAIRRGHAGDRTAFHDAVTQLERAVFAAGRARPIYHFEWAHAVGHARLRGRAGLARSIVERWPDSWRAWYWAAFAVQVRPREQIAILEEATSRHPDRSHLWRLLGQARESVGESAGALHAFERGAAAAPQDVEALSDWAGMLRGLGRDEDALEVEERCLRLAPEHAASLKLRADRAFAAGDRDAALDLYRRAHDRGVPGRMRGYVAFREGVLLSLREDIAGARDAYLRAVADLEGWAPLHNNLANVLHQLGELEEAERHARAALAARPDLLLAYFNLATVLMKRSDWKGLRQTAVAWRERDPDDSRPCYYLAVAHWKLDAGAGGEEALAARRAATRCVELGGGRDPDDLALLAEIEGVLGEFGAAAATIDRAIEVAPPARRPELERARARFRERATASRR